jgi:hypothetical protein
MTVLNIIYTYIHYLIHPFKTHDYFLSPEGYEGFKPEKLSVYESLGTSWIFVVINGLFRIIILNYVLFTFYQVFLEDSALFAELININEYPGFYLLVLSTILDIIFYPLFGFFIIQFWEVVIKLFARLLEVPGDITGKVHDILAVKLSSNILRIIPIFGGPAQGLASIILMYAGLRKQLNASPVLCLCIIFSPIVLVLGVLSIFVLMFMSIALT